MKIGRKSFGIKKVMLISMFAWILRFGLLGLGNPGGGVWMLVLSMLVYGVAFDFFNISGSLFVEQETLFAVLTDTLSELVAIAYKVQSPRVTESGGTAEDLKRASLIYGYTVFSVEIIAPVLI